MNAVEANIRIVVAPRKLEKDSFPWPQISPESASKAHDAVKVLKPLRAVSFGSSISPEGGRPS